jgi:kynurenine formamidase
MSHGEKWGLKPVSNWGRWGKDDQLGTANFITPEVVKRAAAEVRKGVTFTCAIPIDNGGPVFPGRAGIVRLMSILNLKARELGLPSDAIVNDDVIMMPLQGSTQWDSLAHVGYDGHFYNGAELKDVTAHAGAARNSIANLARSLTTRGVLLDMVRYKKAEAKGHLDQGYAITIEDLEACAKAQGVTFQSGDALLLRTGWVPHWYKTPAERATYWHGAPGLALKTAEWIYEKEFSCVAADNITVEVQPSEMPDEQLPFHQIVIRDLGLTIGEIFQFEELAEDCAKDGRYTCMFVAPPLRFTGAVGSPLNPLAIK